MSRTLVLHKTSVIETTKKVLKGTDGSNGFGGKLLAVKYFQSGDTGSISIDNARGGMSSHIGTGFQEHHWYKEWFVENDEQ